MSSVPSLYTQEYLTGLVSSVLIYCSSCECASSYTFSSHLQIPAPGKAAQASTPTILVTTTTRVINVTNWLCTMGPGSPLTYYILIS